MLVAVIALFVVSKQQLGHGTFDIRVLSTQLHMSHNEQTALFLGYAKVGSRGDPHVPEGWSAFGAHPAPDGQPARTKPWWVH